MRRLIDLLGDEALGQALTYVRVFWTWWTAELAALVPARVSQYLRGNYGLTVRPHPQGLSFEYPAGASEIVVSQSQSAQLPPILREQIKRADTIVLLLPAAQVLRRSIELPAAVATDLSSAMSFQITRQTPFPVKQTSYTYRVAGRNKARGTILVEIAMTAKPALEKLQALLAGADIPISAIRIEQDGGNPPLEFDRGVGAWRGSWFSEPWKPIAAAALLVSVLGPSAVAWKVHHDADIEVAAAASSQTAAEAAEKLQRQLVQARAADAFLRRRISGPRAIEILASATRALPDDSWVFDMEVTGERLHLNGYAASVPAILQRLQAVPLFGTIEFPSPVTHDGGSKLDRFDIMIKLRPAAYDNLAAH